MMNLEEINILSTIVEDLYGDAYEPYAGSVKCITKITGTDKMQMTCMMIVNLGNRNEMQTAARDAETSLKKICKDCVDSIKKNFKDRAGRSLKTKEISSDVAVELMNYHAYSDKGTALVRQVHVFEIS
jgi:hypothetical protein